MRRTAEQLTEPDEMTFENSFAAPTTSVVAGSPMHRVDRAQLAEEVGDEFEETFEQRFEWWRERAAAPSTRRREMTRHVLRPCQGERRRSVPRCGPS
jgi:hypothetical protein